MFPVGNWYALTRELPTMQLIVFPQAGYGPQHQYPEACVDYITTFMRTTSFQQSLMPTRKRHLDAILASAGKDMALDRVSETGTMEPMRSGEVPPDGATTAVSVSGRVARA